MKRTIWYTPVLQRFAGEGAAFDGEAGESATADAGQNIGTDSFDEESEFGTLIEGKFKDAFTKRIQAIIDKRFKETKELESYKSKADGVLSALYGKYGIEEGNIEMLKNRMEGEALSNENSELKRREALRKQIGEQMKEADALREIYPDFDFRAEVAGSKSFTQLIRNGVPMKTAYEVIHQNEILGGAMTYTAKKVREQVVRGIETKAARPPENGITPQSGIVTKTDVGALTSQDILKILKQVENGASVSF